MYRKIVLILLIILITVSLSGDDMTLKSIIQNLPETSREYKKNILTLENAYAAYKEDRAVLLPVISYSALTSFSSIPRSFSSNGDELTDYTTTIIAPEVKIDQYLPTAGNLGISLSDSLQLSKIGGTDMVLVPEDFLELGYQNTPNLTLTLTQPICFENVYGAGLTLINENYAIARSNFLMTQNMIVYKLIEAYYNLLYLKKSRELVESGLENVQNDFAEAVKNFEMGRLANIMLLKSEAGLKKAELDLELSKKAYTRALDSFSMDYGVDQDALRMAIEADDFSIGDQVTALNLPVQLLDKEMVALEALRSNVELMIFRKQKELGRAGLIRAKAEDAPLLGLSTSLSFETTETPKTDIGEAFSDPFGDNGSPVFKIQLTLSGKIFDGGSKSNKVKQAGTSLNLSRIALEEKEEATIKLAGHLTEKVSENRKNLDYLKMELNIAGFEYEKGNKDFELGLISRVDFNALRLKYDAVILDYIKPEMTYTLSRIELLMFIGTDLLSKIQGD